MPQPVDDLDALFARGLSTAQVREAVAAKPAPQTPLRCENTQCRVVEYLPHSHKTQDQKCPACYGSPS